MKTFPRLIAAMTQAGVPAPVGPESSVALFDDIFADIGDEQSIEASVSTFSALTVATTGGGWATYCRTAESPE